MNEEIIYECLHCGRKNPKYLGYKGGNCCAFCFKDLKYFVVYDDKKEQVRKLTILLTKKSAEKSMNYDNRKQFYNNLRIVTVEEFELLDLKRVIYYLKETIGFSERVIIQHKGELVQKEALLTWKKGKSLLIQWIPTQTGDDDERST